MKPSHIQMKRQKRKENRRKSHEKKKLWNLKKESLVLKTSTDTSVKSFPEQDSKLLQETTQIFASGDKNHRDTTMDQNKKKKKEKQLPKLKQPSQSESESLSKKIQSPQKAKKKAKHLKEKLRTEKSSLTDSVQHTKQENSAEKRPMSPSKEQPTSAKRLKTKNLVEKRGLSIVSGSSARLDFTSPQELFESIISPVSYEQFFHNYWEKKPLIAKKNDTAVSEAYKALFSRDILKRLLKKQDIEYIRDVNVCRYVNGKRESLNGTGRATCEQINKLFDQSKATLQFHQPQRFQDELWQLCSLLECLFGCLVGANVYMTPPGSQGLAPHYDDVEVFILQLEGRKHWRLYTPPVDLPRDYSRDLEQDSIGQPTHDFVLEAGDMLYFPRGTVHQAATPAGSQHSTHVTISTYQRNSYGDLLTSTLPTLVQSVMDRDVGFRKGLPVGALSTLGMPIGQDNQVMKTHLKKLLLSLADQLTGSSAPLLAPELLQDFMSNRLPPYYKDTSEPLASPKGSPPSLNSFVKMRFPGYMELCSQTAETQDETDDDDDDDDDEEDDGDHDDDEEEDDDDEEDDDHDDDDDDHDDEEDEEDDDSMAASDDEKEGGRKSTMSTAADTRDHEWVYLYHCLHNRREEHMMGSSSGQPQGLKFPATYLPVLQKLVKMGRDDRVQVKGLGLESEDNLQVATYLWAEGLIEIC